MRQIIAISAFSAVAIGAWYLNRAPKNSAGNVSENPAKNPNTTVPGQNTDYLNFDFGSLFGSTPKPEKPYQVEGSNVILPKGIKNHNPLNIEAGRDQWQGMIGNDGRFIIFESVHYGIRAAARIMRNYNTKYGLNTVQGIVNRWAPPSDNNPTESYIAFVASRAGVDAQSPLSMADYPQVIAAMIHFENGYNPYDENTIATATAAGLA
ncbi:hypothetical protein [Shewanella fidelis]|uniref:Structural protein P5 n=1 Tax=Shewanella fidelis TaxID=173509 RepID=A0AAW8NM58_9GAMM|nr:hypothetical protein [Shewanella fidelis]MDR8523840.1 hypothetical protein [Shewanella fidelis]MDW4810388.1 hypothetical protein [Shewanella fidelis]MDW4823724.1 hypothetical protein [Shewanella fidelis]